MSKIFLRDKNGERPVYGGTKKFQDDPYWRDYILFHEYFHGDNGVDSVQVTRPGGPVESPAVLIYLLGWNPLRNGSSDKCDG